jgi:hypothetical protein
MCTACQARPLVLQKKIEYGITSPYYDLLSIRTNGSVFIFTAEHYFITQPGDVYWKTAGLHVCGSCMSREVIDNKIYWRDNDYTNCSTNIGGHLPEIGDTLLNKVLKLKAFL